MGDKKMISGIDSSSNIIHSTDTDTDIRLLHLSSEYLRIVLRMVRCMDCFEEGESEVLRAGLYNMIDIVGNREKLLMGI